MDIICLKIERMNLGRIHLENIGQWVKQKLLFCSVSRSLSCRCWLKWWLNKRLIMMVDIKEIWSHSFEICKFNSTCHKLFCWNQSLRFSGTSPSFRLDRGSWNRILVWLECLLPDRSIFLLSDFFSLLQESNLSFLKN